MRFSSCNPASSIIMSPLTSPSFLKAMRLNLAFFALALAGASAFNVPQPIAFRARSAVYSSSPPSLDQRITETLSEVPCFPFGAGEKGRSADDKWLLGGKG